MKDPILEAETRDASHFYASHGLLGGPSGTQGGRSEGTRTPDDPEVQFAKTREAVI